MTASAQFADGAVVVRYPDGAAAPRALPPPLSRRATDDTVAADPVGDIAAEMTGHDFTLLQALELDGGDSPTAARAATTWTVDVGVPEAGEALILVDHDGALSWLRPTVNGAGRTRRLPHTAEFRIRIGPQLHARASQESSTSRRLLSGHTGRLRAFVFTFTKALVTGGAIDFYERFIARGLRWVNSTDPREWQPMESLADIDLPPQRPARILLFVHGTFSSTVSSFAPLAATTAGRTFLDDAIAAYDAVVGFDHATLGDDPETNARDLLRRLRAAALSAPPTIDIVCYSRGGLVTRSFIESVLPQSDWPAHVRRVVFVGATNAGTSLAHPDKWDEFIDLYTNLAVGAATATWWLRGDLPAADILGDVLAGLGALAKFLVSQALDPAAVPGLAAMRPDGDFIRDINQTQPGQPGPGTPWFVVSSDFEPGLIDGPTSLPELPAHFVSAVIDGLADELFTAANDLVVDTASMSAIDLGVGGFVADTLAFGANGVVHHLAYFLQPEVCSALRDWLLNGTRAVPQGAVVTPDLPRIARRDVLTVDEDDLAAAVQTEVARRQPEWVVIQGTGHFRGDRFALESADITAAVGDAVGQKTSLRDALDVREWHRAPTVDLNDVMRRRTLDGLNRKRRGTVILAQDTPVAVIAPSPPAMALDSLVDHEQQQQQQQQQMEDGGDGAELPTAPATASTPGMVSAHLEARLPPRVRRGEEVWVWCSLSREQFAARSGAQVEDILVDPIKPIRLHIVPALNCKIVGDDEKLVELPPPGEVEEAMFSFTATAAGTCEVQLVARQGAYTLVTMVLTVGVDDGPPGEPPAPRMVDIDVPAAAASDVDDLQCLLIKKVAGNEGKPYYWVMVFDDTGMKASAESEGFDDLPALIAGLYADIERIQRTNTNPEDYLAKLQAYGSELFSRLLPTAVQQELWNHRDRLTRLVIQTDEPAIPWELLHLKEPDGLTPIEPHFLGQTGAVRWLINQSGQPPKRLRARPDRVHCLCARYLNKLTDTLEQVEEEEQFLRDQLCASPVDPPDLGTVRQLLRADFDLFHFAGHGHAVSQGLEQAVIQLGDIDTDRGFEPIYLDVATAKANSKFRGEFRPMIVLNACQTGQAGNLGGFAHAFMEQGAAAFIGTSWAVGDTPAHSFTRALYEHLRGTGDAAGKRATMVEAIVAARAAAEAANDPTWLAYVVYAHPLARLED